MKQRFQVTLDGTGGVFAIDLERGTTRYTQKLGVDDIDLRYEGLRLIVPVVLSEDLETTATPSEWDAIKPLEFLYNTVLIVVPQRVAAIEELNQMLGLFSELTSAVIGWDLLPIFVEESFELDCAGLFDAVINALHKRQKDGATGFTSVTADGLVATLKSPDLDAITQMEVAAEAAKEYASKDYHRMRLASFAEYYADNSLLKVMARGRRFGSQNIDGKQLAARMNDALTTKQPFSFIRVGEGEGCFLSYARYVTNKTPRNEVFGTCAKDIYRIWFNRNIHESATEEFSTVKNLFWQAMCTADVIGVPTTARINFEYAHFVRDIASHGHSRGYVGVSEILYHMEQALHAGQLEGKLFTDCDIARPLYEWQDWTRSLATTLPRLLKGRKAMTLVTCHLHLAEAMQSMLDIKYVRTLLVPPERGRLKSEGYLKGDHYRDYFHSICESLRRDAAPVVLVAAGFLGKTYCAVAREVGSVAIDIGSLADFWAGINTRKKNVWALPSPFVT